MTDITKAIAAAREALAKRDELAHRGNRLRAEDRANWECAQHLRVLLAALDAAQGERGLSSWIINNLLNESQLDVVPPGCDRALRYLDQPQAPPAALPDDVARDAERYRMIRAGNPDFPAYAMRFDPDEDDRICKGKELDDLLDAAHAQQPAAALPDRSAIDDAIWRVLDRHNCNGGDGRLRVELLEAVFSVIAAAVPDGYVPVPVEPTEAMLSAARDWSLKKYGQAVGNDGARGCYAAMLAAANKENNHE